MANGSGAAARFAESVKSAHVGPNQAKLDTILYRDLGSCNSAFYNTSENKPAVMGGDARSFNTPMGAAVALYERGVLMQQHLMTVAQATVDAMKKTENFSMDHWREIMQDLGSLQQLLSNAMNSKRKTSNLQSLSILFKIADDFQEMLDEKKLLGQSA